MEMPNLTRMNRGVFTKLFIMMVLEFVIWGAWLPLIYYYLPALGFTPAQARAKGL